MTLNELDDFIIKDINEIIISNNNNNEISIKDCIIETVKTQNAVLNDQFLPIYRIMEGYDKVVISFVVENNKTKERQMMKIVVTGDISFKILDMDNDQ